MSEMLIVRHGETAWNRDQVFRGRADMPLSERGREQAARVANALKDAGIQAIYSSPLTRALETAAPLASLLGITVIPDQRLIDMSFGEWEGKSRAEVEQAHPDLSRLWHEEPQRFRAPGGESLAEVLARSWPALDAIASQHERAAVVSHRVVCKVLVLTAAGSELDAFWRIRLDTASISAIEQNERGWVVTRMNETHHLRAMGEMLAADF